MTSRRTPRRQISSRRIRYAAPALEKGLDILELLASVSESLTHSEIASRLGRTVTEVFRMLVCLEERGYLSRTGADERYQLTLKLFEIIHQHRPLAASDKSGAPAGAAGGERNRTILPSGHAEQCRGGTGSAV